MKWLGMWMMGAWALGGSLVAAQEAAMTAPAAFALRQDGPVIRQAVASTEPFTVAGERGVLVGQQRGEIEAWVLPVKLLSHLTVEARVEGYAVPIALNDMARAIEVRPDRTTITYSHIGLVVRQIMFAPDDAPAGTGAVVMFQVDALHPVDLTFRFTAELRSMWPELSSGASSSEWVKRGTEGEGFYVLHSDFSNFAGAVTIPGARSGIMAPYQERPQTHPTELLLHVDPVKDKGKVFPLLMAVGRDAQTASAQALGQTLAELDAKLPALYAQHAARYAAREGERMRLVSPDTRLNEAFGWAETSMDQLRARTAGGDTAFVAGYYASGDSARPGFGWFFGRDSLYTLFALNSYGDFADAKAELAYLAKQQRADGKIMHERSQTAEATDWAALPYQFAAADSTPLFLMALNDYVRASGDTAFLREHAEVVRKAWEFETTHDANGDGIFDNAQGTGWVESWQGVKPQQEIYLASLDEQASDAMAQLASALGQSDVASAASARAKAVHATLEKEYFQAGSGRYAFSHNREGDDLTDTVFPAVAWWTGGHALEHPQESLSGWASHRFDTDWGVRSVANNDPRYNSMSYHEGSVWPLFTGWQALAEYRGGHPLAGWTTTMQNVDLTWAQDPGAVTELLSGDFYEPFGRSTSHQLWSSAMVVTPLVRGMFGLETDALKHTVRVAPHLPAGWDHVSLERVHVGASVVDVVFRREATGWTAVLKAVSGEAVKLEGADGRGVLHVVTPAVEVQLPHGLPPRGSRTQGLKVLNEVYASRSLKLELEAPAGSVFELKLRRHSRAAVTAEGARLEGDVLQVSFGAGGEGYSTQVVMLHW